jgi:hypothetical protein
MNNTIENNTTKKDNTERNNTTKKMNNTEKNIKQNFKIKLKKTQKLK